MVMYEKSEISRKISHIINELFHLNIKDEDTPFSEVGVISIHIPPFVKKLNETYGLNIPVAALFSFTNLNELSGYVYKLLNTDEKAEKKVEVKQNSNEDDKIAIIGMSGRFPAGANSIEELWDVLMSGKDGIVDIPETRWELEKYYDENKEAVGKMYCKKGGFLNLPIDEFDAVLFNISPKEAPYLDPQQRLLLELTWEAFENAGLDISKYFGENVGVYLGLSADEYSLSGIYSGDLSRIDAYSLTGGCMSAICGRVSYLFGFEGPCFGVDTACSSSLTALHLACNAIKSGDTDMAVVAGVNMILSPTISVAFSKLQATSPDGRSKSFDASADGYGRAEGGGVILVKKLSEAIKDKDNILGVICATGINQDGNSNGLTAPNGKSQAKLMRKALSISKLTSNDVDYVEMHGTGTKLGDPIEVGAVAEVYGENRNNDNPLRIGSIKSNIGHLEPAAGMASIAKVLLSLQHETIPANLHFTTPNPYIDWGNMPVKVVAEASEWKKDSNVRRAAINGFGFGGSNAHVIIEEYKPENISEFEASCDNDGLSGINYILKISAKNEKSLREYIYQYIKYIEKCAEKDFADFVYSANRGRTDFNYRLAVTGTSKDEISDKLKSFLIGGNPSGIFCSHNEKTIFRKDRKFVFMFTGQGSQYVNMGKMLYESNMAFRENMDTCNKLFKPFILVSLLELLYGKNADSSVIEKTVYAQPLIFSIDYSLCKMWESYGIKPEIVMGHSIGEYIAAVVSGIFSLEDAVKLVSIRGRLMDQAPGDGAMANIYTNEKTVQKLIEDYRDTVSIAAINAKESIVISGQKNSVEEILINAEKQGLRSKRLKVSHAFHSTLMEPILEDFRSIASEVRYNTPQVRYVSALYGKEISKSQILGADYWTTHIREKVDFYHAIKSIESGDEYIYLEVGSNSVLSALCKLIFDEDNIVANTLNISKDSAEQMSEAIALLYAAGTQIQWSDLEFCGKKMKNKISVPNYPYDKQKFWLDLCYDHRETVSSSLDVHPLLGDRIESPFMKNTVIFQRKFRADEPYFMSEHVIFNVPISPAAAYVSFLLSAVKELKNPPSCTINSIEFRAPLAVEADGERVVQFIFTEKEGGLLDFNIVSRDNTVMYSDWVTHAMGEIQINSEFIANEIQTDFGEFYRWGVDPVTPEEGTYELMRSSGFYLGDGFRRIMKTATDKDKKGDYVCQVIPFENIPDADMYTIYPGTIDSIFQTATLLEVTRRVVNDKLAVNTVIEETMIPYFMEKFTYNYVDMSSLQTYTSIRSNDTNFIHSDIEAFNERGELVVKIKELMARITNREGLLQGIKGANNQFFYHPEWIKTEVSHDLRQSTGKEKYVIIADDNDNMKKIAKYLNDYGINPISVLDNTESFVKSQDDSYEVDLRNDEMWKKLLSDLTANNEDSSIKLIYCCGMSRKYKYENGMVHNVDTDCLKKMLCMVQTIDKLNYRDKIGIKILTMNAKHADGEQGTNLSQAPLWGFAKVLGLEFPNMYEGIVDVDDNAFDNSNLITELIDKSDDEVCLYGGARYIGRVVKHVNRISKSKKENISLTVKEDGTYLITGGTGAVGMVFTERLVNMGAKNVVLICRNQPKEQVSQKIEAFKQQGVRVELAYADICDEDSIRKALTELKERMPKIRGVVHAAGTISDKFIADQTWENFEKVLEPKTKGLINLYNLLDKDNLDFLILLSSITAVIGNLGQSNYACANYFLNCFADEMTRKGAPVYATCWGPWQSGGMAAEREEVARNMNAMGLKAFSSETAGNIIEQFFAHPYNGLMIADIDWKVMGSNTSSRRQKLLLEEILSEYITNDENSEEVTKVFDTLVSIGNIEEKRVYLLDILQKACSKIMGFRKSDMMDVNVALREQGADSLMMFSMRSTVNKLLHTDIDVSTFFNYPTLVELTNYLIDTVLFPENINESEATSEEIDQDNGDDILDKINDILS